MPPRKIKVGISNEMSWNEFVHLYRAKHPNLTLKEALVNASPLYKQAKQQVGAGVIDDMREWLWNSSLNPLNVVSSLVKRAIQGSRGGNEKPKPKPRPKPKPMKPNRK